MPQIIRNGEYHRLYVEGKRIVIDGLDPDQLEGYWGGAEDNLNLRVS